MNSTTPQTNGTTTKHTTTTTSDNDDPVVNAREFVHAALDGLDRLLGIVIGMIDDRAYAPDDSDAERVRKVSSQVRSNLLAADAKLSIHGDLDPASEAVPASGAVPSSKRDPSSPQSRHPLEKESVELREYIEGIAEAESELSEALSELNRSIFTLACTRDERKVESIQHALEHEALKLFEHAHSIRTFARLASNYQTPTNQTPTKVAS